MVDYNKLIEEEENFEKESQKPSGEKKRVERKFCKADYFPKNKDRKVRFVGPWVRYYVHSNIEIWQKKYEDGKFKGVEKRKIIDMPCLSQNSKYADPDNCPLCKLFLLEKQNPDNKSAKFGPRRFLDRKILIYDENEGFMRYGLKGVMFDEIMKTMKGVVDEDSGEVMLEGNPEAIDFTNGISFAVKRQVQKIDGGEKISYSCTAINKPAPIPEELREEYEEIVNDMQSSSNSYYDVETLRTLCFEENEAIVYEALGCKSADEMANDATDKAESEVDTSDLPF